MTFKIKDGILVAGIQFVDSSTNVSAASVSISNITSATSTTTGALIVAGGVGISGTVWAGDFRTSATNIILGNLATSKINSSTVNSVAIGTHAAGSGQGSNSIAIGKYAGWSQQATNNIAIGTDAGTMYQGNQSLSTTVTTGAIAIGLSAGHQYQSPNAIAIGSYAGANFQTTGSIAIGMSAGVGGGGGQNTIAIGNGTGGLQLDSSIAIGNGAGGAGQGVFAIAIGANASSGNDSYTSQSDNSIVLNATGLELDAFNSGLYIAPIRFDASSSATAFTIYYNPNTGELTTATAYSFNTNTVVTTAYNIAQYPLNQSVATTSTPTFANLNVAGTITANQLTIQYTTITQSLVTSPDIFTITNTTTSIGTQSGALTVAGGVGVGDNLSVGGIMRGGVAVSDTSPSFPIGGTLWWDSTIGNLRIYYAGSGTSTWVDAVPLLSGITNITGGTDITVSLLGSSATISDSSTLQSVSTRGATTNNAINITNATLSNTTNSGALTVVGGVGVGGSLYVGGTINASTLTVSSLTGILYSNGAGGVITTSSISASLTNALSISTGLTGVSYNGSTPVTIALNTSTLMALAVTATYAQSFNTGTLVANAVSATNITSYPLNQSVSTSSSPTFANLNVTGTATSTSTTTGALVVTGGVGVNGTSYFGGTVSHIGNTLFNQSYDQGTGKIQAAGTSTFNGIVTESTLNLQGGNNLLTYSNTFSDASWGRIGTTATTGADLAPDGTTTAWRLVEDASTLTHVISKSYTNSGISAPTANSIYVKVGGGAKRWLYIQVNNGGPNNLVYMVADLTTGSVSQSGILNSGFLTTATVTSLPNSWYRVTLVGGVNNVANYSYVIALSTSSTPGTTTPSYIGDNASYLLIWQPQAEYGTVASAPTVTTSTAITTVNNINLPSGSINIGQQATSSLNWNLDTYLYRDAANILAQRNGTISQALRVYNSYTNSTNYEAGVLDWKTTANTLLIGTQAAGTGVVRNINLVGGTVSVLNTTSSTSTTTGALVVTGGVGIGGNLTVGGSITATNFILNGWQVSTSTGGTFAGGTVTGATQFTNTASSTSTTTGAVTVTGGVGIGGNLSVGGTLTVGGQSLLPTDSLGNVTVTSTANSISTSTGALQVRGGVGIALDMWVGGNSYALGYQSTSDETQKTNIQIINNATNIVENLRGVTFDWLNSTGSSAGLIAQDVEKYLPQLISQDSEGIKNLNYNGIVGVLVEAVKQLNKENTQLTAKVNDLDLRIEQLSKLIKGL